jgi:VWFA-related protein
MRCLFVACAISLAAGASWANDMPVFSTEVEMVRLDVSVTHDGQPVKGLTAADFEVKDNGVAQEVELVGGEDKTVDVVLALDTSSSLAGLPLGRLKAAAHAFVDVLHPQDAFSLLTFSDRIQATVAPGDRRERAHEVIEATQARLSTALYDAVFAALSLADSTRGRPLVLVFSDGQDVGSWCRPERVLRLAKESDLVVYAVVTRLEGSEVDLLRELATVTGGEVWPVEHQELKEILLRAIEEFRTRYTLRYALTGPAHDGWHKIEVSVKHAPAAVRARKGYWHR